LGYLDDSTHENRATAIPNEPEPVVTVQFTRQHVVDVLRKAGFREAADEAMRVLPDPVDLDYAARWAAPYGITESELISRMGGSP
jgi:hypothetical protein